MLCEFFNTGVCFSGIHKYQMQYIPQMPRFPRLPEVLSPRFHQHPSRKAVSRCLQEGWGHPACSVPSDSWNTTSLPIKPRCHQLNWKVAGLQSCQRTWVWPVVFAFLVAEWKSPGQLSQPKLSLWVWQFKEKENDQKQAKVFPVSSSTHSHGHLLPHPQGPKLQQLMPAGSGVPEAFQAENCLWPLPDLGKVVQKVFYTVQLKAAHKH